MDAFDTTAVAAAIDAALLPTVPGSHERGWIASAVEVACLDAQGMLTGRPAIGDGWGEALDPAGIVEQARVMRQRYGFDSFKLKGGVFPPDEGIAAMKALAEAFPGSPLRLDPNTAWTVETSRQVARELDGVIEYLEDPTPTIPGMTEVAETSPMPLATNMCVIAWEHPRPAVEHNAIQVLLTDHHYPWNSADDVIVPGLGVELDHDDTGCMRRFHSEYELRLPRW